MKSMERYIHVFDIEDLKTIERQREEKAWGENKGRKERNEKKKDKKR